MESCLADLGKSCVEKLINGALSELRYVFCFTCIADEFNEKKIRLEAKIKTLEQRAKVAAGRHKDILARVPYLKEKADKLIQEDIKIKQTCFFGLFPDCIWRYKKGKELTNYRQEIKRLIEKGEKLDNIELTRHLPNVECHSSESYISFQSRESKYKELLDALKDDNNYIIVLQGMGGTGKTTLAIEVGKELWKSKEFAHVIDITMSMTPDTKTIQDDIAGSLGLKLDDGNDSDRPKRLRSRLTIGEKILLIMDDVWDQGPPLDFDLIGIPKQDDFKGCRVLITTRSKRIFNILGCDKMIELDLLPEEEAWTMFKMYAGISNNSSQSLISTGRKIAKECKQLPAAIAVIASSLKGQQHSKYGWDAILKSLKKDVSMEYFDEEKDQIYKCLKYSYDLLMDERAKGLFLLSSVFPEDKEIPIEILTRLAIGTGLFGKNYGSYNDARNQVVVAKDKLIDSCLLVWAGEKHVKMHDLVREGAQWIANNEIQSVNLSNEYEKSWIQREINIKYLFCEGKNKDLFSWKYNGSKLETLIVDVKRDQNREGMEMANSFIEKTSKLQVLYFSGHDKLPLSLSHLIHSLTNIRSILVDRVDLGDISVLGNLQSLETLDLVECIIDELPPQIAKLGKLELLNLERCEIRKNDPFEVIKRCPTLEELYFIDSFNDFCREITLPQLQSYRIRKGHIMIGDSLSKYVSFDAGYGDECCFSNETFKYFMQTTEGLQLNGIKVGWRNLMPEIVPIDQCMKDLVELRLRCISQLQCLIDTNGSEVPNVLSKLVVLELEEMENLKELFNGSISFDSLKNLEELSIRQCEMFQGLFNCELNLCNLKTVTIWNCPMLVNLFPLLTSRNLVQLEELIIIHCEGLKNIVMDDADNDDKSHDYPMFPKLKALNIFRCHLLESIFPFLSFQDFPVLEVIHIKTCDKLKYIFGQYQHVELTSQKETELWQSPNFMKEINLSYLPNFIGIFPEYSHSMSSLVNASSSTSRDGSKAQTQVDPIKFGSSSTTKVPSVNEDPVQNNSSASVSSLLDLLQIREHAQCLLVQSRVMCNIKEITLSGPLKIKSVFILSITQIMLVETLTIENCDELKHIIVDFGDDENVGNNLVEVFPKLKMLIVKDCKQLRYIFGHYSDGHQNHNEIRLQLPALQYVQLSNLPSLVSICPKQYGPPFPHLKELQLKECSLDNTIMKFLYMPKRGQCLPLQSNISCNVKEITLSGFSKIKSVFNLSVAARMSVETLRIESCDELKHIIVDIGYDGSDGNNWGKVFPKMKRLSIKDCRQLEYILGHYTDDHQNHNKIHLHLQALQCLQLCNLSSLIAMCPKQYRTTFSPLLQLELKDCSLDNTILKELSGSMEHFIGLESLLVYNSKVENIPCLNGIEGKSMNLRLEKLELYDMHYMMYLFAGPKNSFALQNLTEIKIVRCEKLEVVFSTSILRCLSQLIYLRIEECKELKHIIEDDRQNQNFSSRISFSKLMIREAHEVKEICESEDDRKVEIQNLNLSSNTCFPKLKTLVVIKCYKLKCVFSISTCKKLPELETLMIKDAIELEEIFKSEGDQKVEIPKLNIVAFVNLPSLFDIQEIQFQAAKYRFIQNCQNLSLTSASTHSVIYDIDRLDIDISIRTLIRSLFEQLQNESRGQYTGNENSSAEIAIDVANDVGIEVETALGHDLTSSQIQMKQTLNEDHDFVKNASDLEIQSLAKLPTKSKKLEKEQSTSQRGLINQQGPLGEIDSTSKPSQGDEEGTTLTNAKTLTPSTHLKLVSSSQEQDVDVRCSRETSKLNDDQDFQTSEHFESPCQQLEDQTKGYNTGNENSSAETTNDVVVGVDIEVEAPLRHGLASSQIPRAGHEIVGNASDLEESEKEQPASQPSLINQQDSLGEIDNNVKHSQEQDVDVRDSLETPKINDDQVSQNGDFVMKVSTIIEQQFPKDDESSISISKPSPSNGIPFPLAFQTHSMPSKEDPSQIVEDLSSSSFVTQELEQLVSKEYLDNENLSLLTDFLVKHPLVLLSDNSLSNGYKGSAYKCLAKLLKFLQIHSVLDVLGSSHSEFVELLHDVRSFRFDKGWLDDVEKHALFSDLQFSQDALQKLLDSNKQVTEGVEVVCLKIDILNQHVEDLKHQFTSSKPALESITQQEREILESKAGLNAPIGF